MLNLSNITLIGVDCLDVDRLAKAINICLSYANFGAVKLLTSLETDNKYAVKIPHIGNINDYSKFMIRELYKYVDTDFALCIQWDGFLVNPDNWDDEFLNYSYVGAPWWFTDKNVGNGGCSLRSKQYLIETSKMPTKNYNPEDLICCRVMRGYLESKGIKFAPEELAHRFSHEGNQKFGRTWRKQPCFHDFQMTDMIDWEGYKEFIRETKLDY